MLGNDEFPFPEAGGYGLQVVHWGVYETVMELSWNEEKCPTKVGTSSTSKDGGKRCGKTMLDA